MFDTLKRMIRQMETMTAHHISISHAIEILERNTKNYEELIVINVIRESFNEVITEEGAEYAA